MKYLQNTTAVHLMVWEIDPRKRNLNNIIKVNAKEVIKEGDVIIGNLVGESLSLYVVDDILNKRDSLLKHMQYYTLKTSFKWMHILEYERLDAVKVQSQMFTDHLSHVAEKVLEEKSKSCIVKS